MPTLKTSIPRHRIAIFPIGMEERSVFATGGYSGQRWKADVLARGATVAPPPLHNGRRHSMDGSGRTVPQGCARSPINETKLAVLSVLDAFGGPVRAQELYQVWGGAKSPAILDYHLSTLVRMGVVEVVMGPELHFDLACAEAGAGSREGRCTDLR